ncbi:MAG: sigma-70 family RNA polymerase sigma factor [Oceanicaulis sp.]
MDDTRVTALIQRVSLADRAAFSELYDATSSRLFAIVLRIVKDSGEAQDALQDCYANLWRRAKSFDPEKARPMAWLAMIARNAAIDRLRRRRPAGSLEALDEPVDDAPSPEASAVESDEARRVRACLEELTGIEAGLLTRAYYGGESYSEVAAAVAKPLGTVKSVIRRSLMKMRRCLER